MLLAVFFPEAVSPPLYCPRLGYSPQAWKWTAVEAMAAPVFPWSEHEEHR
jgi:hypothetical protein